MNVYITDSAVRDLMAIAGYIGQHQPDRAASFVDELLDHCEALAQFPQRYPWVPRYEHHGIRRYIHANYLIFYRVGTQQFDVIHILSGAQEYEFLLFPGA